MNLRLTLMAAAALAVAATSVDAVPHVHHSVHRTLQESGKANIVVKMASKPKEALKALESLSFLTRGLMIESMVNKLESLAADTQTGIDALLAKESATGLPLFEEQHRSWAMNARLFNGATLELVQMLSSLPGVESIREQVIADISTPDEIEAASIESLNTVEWGVERIGAPKVWADGNNGQNVVVGIIDTGVRATHEILKRNLRATYNWYDPANHTQTPFDSHGHGTHVAGTIAGIKGYGVAPGAKYMACRGCPDGRCPEFALVQCGEFMACPTDAKGENKDCSKAPNVINNSWGGDGGDDFYADVVAAWHKAGIIPVFALGNDGPNCSTAGSPGDYGNVIGVGAVSENNTLAFFSSRGPALNTSLTKPDISAPGLFIKSAWNSSDTDYRNISGTSMATPHVVGAVALLLSAEPKLNYQQVYTRLVTTTDQGPFNSTLSPGWGGEDTCGGIKETEFPNNHYGHGRLNILSAYQGFRPSTPGPTTSAPTTPAATSVMSCSKWQNKPSCQAWLWCNWDQNTKTCGDRL